MAKQGRGSEQAMIRLPDGMRDRLKREAEANGRSMNAEIVERLQYALDHPATERADLLAAIQRMDAELDDSKSTIAALNKHVDELFENVEAIKFLADQTKDFHRRIMYNVLNYIDNIPEELALWVFEIILALEREEFATEALKGSAGGIFEMKEQILRRRDVFRKQTMELLRQHLDESRTGQSDVSPET